MRLESEDIIQQPAAIVYPLVRDEMQKIVPYLNDIESIETKTVERQEDGRLQVVNHWKAKANMPSVAKKFMKPEMMAWKDYALWNDDEFCVEYRLESFLGNDLFDAKGTNYFKPHGENGEATLIRVTCDVEIYPERIPGVPKFLAKRVRPTIEQMIEKMLKPNLTSLGKGLMAYFSDPANRPSDEG